MDSRFVPLYLTAIVYFGNECMKSIILRSCADQLFGDQNRHGEVRRNAVHYMMTHKNEYAPFMDEEREPFNNVISFLQIFIYSM